MVLTGKELASPVILPENIWNMDEIGVLLSVLNSLKVLVGRHELKTHCSQLQLCLSPDRLISLKVHFAKTQLKNMMRNSCSFSTKLYSPGLLPILPLISFLRPFPQPRHPPISE
jgi:hypothetical protein